MEVLCKASHNLGRKNYLFAGSNRGAERAAMMYSFCIRPANPSFRLADEFVGLAHAKNPKIFPV